MPPYCERCQEYHSEKHGHKDERDEELVAVPVKE